MPDSLRSLPRIFLPGASAEEPFELPQDELDKLRKVLRLKSGDPIAVLPNDGTLIRCTLQGRQAIPEKVERPNTEPKIRLTIAQALPKGDRIETVIRMGTEIGVSRFILFPAERSIVRWEPSKLAAKLKRLQAIAREAAEQSFRTRLPEIESQTGLKALLEAEPEAIVLSEMEGVPRHLSDIAGEKLKSEIRNPQSKIALVIGPEGGWSPKEIALIGNRAATLGPLVLRTDTAGLAAASMILLDRHARK